LGGGEEKKGLLHEKNGYSILAESKILKLPNLVSSINQKKVGIHNSSEDSCEAQQQA
jgi:hypothetical protein